MGTPSVLEGKHVLAVDDEPDILEIISDDKGIPTVMLTAHAVSPDTLMESIRKGAISYLPKEKLIELDELLSALMEAHQRGAPLEVAF